MVAGVVERLWYALQIPVPLQVSSSLLENKEDAPFNSCHSIPGSVEQEMVHRQLYSKGKTLMDLRAIGSDTWKLLVA